MIFYILYRRNMRDSYMVQAENIKAEDYDLVAAIEADDLGDVFRIMNAVDGSDFEVPQKIRNRSMSVGDVALEAEHKTVSLCCVSGWEHFSDDKIIEKCVQGCLTVPQFKKQK